MTINWYVLRSNPNREEFLEEQLISRNFGVYYPRLRVKPVNPRSRKQETQWLAIFITDKFFIDRRSTTNDTLYH